MRPAALGGLAAGLAALACLLVLPVAGHAQALPDALYDRFNRDIVRGQVIPGYRAFAAETARLDEAANAYCAAPDDAAHGALIDRYHDAYDAWEGVQWLGFGPAKDFMRIMRIQFWPDSRNTLTRHIATLMADPRTDLLDPAVLADASVALQGFPALERLLFDDAPPGEDAYACALAAAIAANLAQMAADLAAVWDPIPDDPEASARAAIDALGYPEPAALTGELYQALYFHLEAILTVKLARPMGETLEDARATRGESWRSGRSMRNIRRNLSAIRGLLDNGDALGFADIVAETAGRPDLADALRAALDEAIAAADALAGPFTETLADPALRGDFVRLATALNSAREYVAVGVGEALGLAVGFNSLDGD